MGGGNSGRPASVLWGGGSEGLVAQGFGYQATFAALETVVTERLNFHHIKDSLSSRASNSRTRPCADWNASEGSAFSFLRGRWHQFKTLRAAHLVAQPLLAVHRDYRL